MSLIRCLIAICLFVVVLDYKAYANKIKSLPDGVTFDGVSAYKSDEILVKRKSNTDLGKVKNIHKKIGAKVLREYFDLQRLELVRIPKAIGIMDAIKIYQMDENIEYAEPNFYFHIAVGPNDPEFSKQWALNNTAQGGGVADSDINAPEAWEMSKGSEEFVLGIIDTGVLYTHPDLAENMWVNKGEIPGNNIDDDNNGFVDDIHGINAIKNNGDPLDDNGHGTHVAGIIGARGDNRLGICGVNQTTAMVACKFLDASGSGSASDAITCLNYFASLKERANFPVRIVATNNSWAGGGFSQALFDAIKEHEQNGIMFVAAASNEGRDNDRVDTYPADYGLSNIISVAASDNKDALAYFSNFGSQTVHVAAPGVNILSTYLGNSYKELSGTSMAAPQVAGLVGLIYSARPHLDYSRVRNLIISGGEPIPAAQGKTISGRRIRAVDAGGIGSLTCSNQIVQKRVAPIGNTISLNVGNSMELAVMSLNCDKAGPTPFFQSDEVNLSLNDHGIDGDRVAEDGVFSTVFAPDRAGTYHFDFGDGQMVTVNVLNPLSWFDYQVGVDTNFQYRVISGKKLAMTDDNVQQVKLPFSFKFAGDEIGFSTIQVGANGLLSVTNSDITAWQNTALPSARVQTLLAPYWDDLDPGRHGGGVYYDVLGAAPHREFVIEWRNIGHFSGGNSGSFQVVIFEDTSDVLFNYQDVDFGNAYGFGKSATIGLQVSDKRATQFTFNEANLSNNMALRFTKSQAPISPLP